LIFYLDPDAYEEIDLTYKFIQSDSAGYKLREVGLMYWDYDDGVTNEMGFNARGGGVRKPDGSFYGIKMTGAFTWSDSTFYYQSSYVEYSSGMLLIEGENSTGISARRYGQSARLIKDSTILTHGQTGTYIGNDGKIYRTICIGTQEWLAENLCETKYRNGEDIPEVTDNGAWAALTTAGMCAYNNDWSNV
jgi:hypothetical protein